MRNRPRKPQYNKNGIKMDTDRPPRKKQKAQAIREEMLYQGGTKQQNKRKNSDKRSDK
ncbi:hypothetical protein [Gracilibacillus thailandensis]|uniref:Uncharacterized protein n=1 Tax=Gracilibacillus thailandensis TaxID=563735 RepID=A0A6N7QX94_9BACI|nr:hypothetical protein [Gracilibacillus thailandensis]MRI65350.1 hypothetical protein [Gracilibacillus thailandensis]